MSIRYMMEKAASCVIYYKFICGKKKHWRRKYSKGLCSHLISETGLNNELFRNFLVLMLPIRNNEYNSGHESLEGRYFTVSTIIEI